MFDFQRSKFDIQKFETPVLQSMMRNVGENVEPKLWMLLKQRSQGVGHLLQKQ
jgi:hypothetical protein